MAVTASLLTRLCPSAKPDIVDVIVRGWPQAEAAGITTNLRLRHFLARIAVETGGLRAVSENLSYSVRGLQRTWPKRFPTIESAKPFAHSPEALAIKVYGGHLGNAPAPSRDGWIYRGAGMMQTTGRANFKALGFEDNPDALRNPEIAFATAVREWKNRGCNAIADRDDAKGVCVAINGGTNGLDEQKRYLAVAGRLWP